MKHKSAMPVAILMLAAVVILPGCGEEETPVDASVVIARSAAVLRRTPDTPVLVRADTAVEYGRVVSAMVLLQRAGAEQVGFITDPAEAPGIPEVEE